MKTYTEDQVRRALAEHTPGARWCNDGTADLECSCSYRADAWPDGAPKYAFVEWTVEHFMEALALDGTADMARYFRDRTRAEVLAFTGGDEQRTDAIMERVEAIAASFAPESED